MIVVFMPSNENCTYSFVCLTYPDVKLFFQCRWLFKMFYGFGFKFQNIEFDFALMNTYITIRKGIFHRFR